MIPRADGTYHVIVVRYDVTDNSFTGKAYLPQTTDSGNLTSFSGGHGSYSIEAGELKAKADFLTGGQLRLQAVPLGCVHRPRGLGDHPQAARGAEAHQHLRQGGCYYGIRPPTPSCGSTRSRCASASTSPTTAPDLGGGQAAALVHRRYAAEPVARRRRAVLRRRRTERPVLAPRPDRRRRRQLRLERRRLQQLRALLPLHCRLRRLPQHLRARRPTPSAPRSGPASRNSASTPTTSSVTRSR